MRKKDADDWESASDYLASGLRELPLNITLLYNFAAVQERLGQYKKSLRFFGYCEELRQRWTECLFGQAVIYFKFGNFKKAKDLAKVAIYNYKQNSLPEFNHLLYFKAMCFKKLGKIEKAKRDYGYLTSVFD